MASKWETLLLLLAVLALTCDNSLAAKRRKPTPTTTAAPTTTEAAVLPGPGPGTDTMIYHGARTNDRCECGAFKTPKKSVESPLYYQIAMQNFHCDEESCKQMCLGLPAFSLNRGVEILCAHLNSAVGLRPAVHYKNCNDNWMYAGSTPKTAICCEGGKSVPCQYQ